MKTVSACFVVLVTPLSDVAELRNATHAGILLKRLQSVTNSAARLLFSSQYDHVGPLLRQLH